MRVVFTLYAALMIARLIASSLAVGAVTPSSATMVLVWCMALAFVLRRWRWAKWLALSALLPVVALLGFQSYVRASLLAAAGGFASLGEGLTAFLVTWAIELAFLVGGIVLCVWLLRGTERADG